MFKISNDHYKMLFIDSYWDYFVNLCKIFWVKVMYQYFSFSKTEYIWNKSISITFFLMVYEKAPSIRNIFTEQIKWFLTLSPDTCEKCLKPKEKKFWNITKLPFSNINTQNNSEYSLQINIIHWKIYTSWFRTEVLLCFSYKREWEAHTLMTR